MSFKRDSETNLFVPTAHFKMPKQVKRTLATILDKDLRDQWRNVSAQSVMQSFEEITKAQKSKNKGS